MGSILLELDPNIVKPGWTPLLITLGIALAMVLLFRSMRRQFRRVDENFPARAASRVAADHDAPATDSSEAEAEADGVAGPASDAELRRGA